MKHSAINLTRNVKDLHTKNHKTLLREMKENLNQMKNQVLWLGTLNIIMMSILLTLI